MDSPKKIFPRYLVNPEQLDGYEEVTVDVLVIGGGVAGLSAAISAASTKTVAVVTKDWLSVSNTEYAQGGVAAVLGNDDSFEDHIRDTISVCQGLGEYEVIREVVERGPGCIRRMVGWGGQFDKVDGDFELAKEGGHKKGRVLHASGDATGREIQRVLTEHARSLPRISIHEHAFVLDILTSQGRVVGALTHLPRGFVVFRANAVIICTGGSGQLYRETTNPEVATADGLAIALRAGATLRGMEFVQFHPTTLYIAGVARILVSETLRGEGGVLRDKDGRRFMPDYHPDAELAPRDVVSRSILETLAKTGHTNVYLDLTHLPSAYVRERFPKINRACSDYGIDITREMIPVHPSCHYMIGGIKIDAEGRTDVPGLYAAGEAACSGLHGANRLGSNSLLEGLVHGYAAGKASAAELVDNGFPEIDSPGEPRDEVNLEFDATDMGNALKAMMWRQVGIQRDRDGLRDALSKLDSWSRILFRIPSQRPNIWELTNMVSMGILIARSALLREETRGTHFRKDFPERCDERWRGYLELQLDSDRSVEERFVALDEAATVMPNSEQPA